MRSEWADDHLARRFEAGDLLTLVAAGLRRDPAAAAPATALTYRFGNVEVDFRRTVRREGVVLGLSAKEYQLLCYFIQNRGDDCQTTGGDT
jgi:DNA-binding response OmpR family regulator